MKCNGYRIWTPDGSASQTSEKKFKPSRKVVPKKNSKKNDNNLEENSIEEWNNFLAEVKSCCFFFHSFSFTH